jgi:dipeptidase E
LRLFLASMFMGNHGDRLVSMAGRAARVALIPNALDNFPGARAEYMKSTVYPLFGQHGFRAEQLDLSDYFARPSALAEDLEDFDLVWAIGGNSFLLRRAMRQSGFDHTIRTLLETTSMIYGGWSAGAVVAGSDLFGIDHVDDPHATAPGYLPGEPLWEGLGLIDCSLVPHVDSDHPESAAAGQSVSLIRASGRRVQTLGDGDVLIKEGTKTFVLN